MSALDAQLLASKSSQAGARGVDDFARVGSRGAEPKNMCRDMLRACLKGTDMPDLYWAKVPCCNPKTGIKREDVWMPFLLPHELLHLLVQKAGESWGDLCSVPSGLEALRAE
eukprot:3609369-Pyramimonas_sp.AAC.2